MTQLLYIVNYIITKEPCNIHSYWIESILTKVNSMTLLSFRAALLLTFSTVIFLFITVKLLLNDLYFMVIWF